LRGDKTVAELASQYEIHPTMLNTWKRQLLENASELFDNGKTASKAQSEVKAENDELYRQIGKLKVERDFLAKPLSPTGTAQRKALVEAEHPELSLVRQCQLLGISRSSLYYQPVGPLDEELTLLRLIDQMYLEMPFYGSRRMTAQLQRLGYRINRKRVRRLMRQLGLQAVYPKPKLSMRHPEHKIYPYLLRGVDIVSVNQVWSTDITYLPVLRGHFYLVAVMDWYSRKVLSWRIANTMDVAFCLDALEEALSNYAKPTIFNSDQAAQFTANAFTNCLQQADVQISMDGRGRCHDNIFIERLWRSVKWELIYLKAFENGNHLSQEVTTWFHWYNRQRLHQSLNYRTPDEVYAESR
ncbi:IS3 family transposase, partial [Vasconcelosia minhoensis]|uniref:IS3 family transposase n=1 Tax=Vasconcelosia minhoensis TaxID=3366354 RepID=UPI0036F425FF